MTAEPLFDLASLTKPLVTAPLALQHLDLDEDRRTALGFQDRPEPLTVRQLLSHSAGLPPWLPFTGQPLPDQLMTGFPVGAHPLLRTARVGTSTYSDLGYRLLGELLEHADGRSFQSFGEAFTGLSPAPWRTAPVAVPDGPDAAAWAAAAPGVPLPPRSPFLPHDANARAGMRGHAGFGATPSQLRAWLERWVQASFPGRMAVDTATAEDGGRWGLGLQRALGGRGRFGWLLEQVPQGAAGVHMEVSTGDELAEPAPQADSEHSGPTAWWMHFGYTGPALFVRPTDGLCICLLLHRRGPSGEMLDLSQMQARRWRMLARVVACLGAEARP